ncbi:proline-rich protein 2-like [Pezoporus occidentalis]|uniref:proline-rich protein 2-like n=1 Tax=Pezoporus occidentalis TaxID=407982 RepID=UPI002F91039C
MQPPPRPSPLGLPYPCPSARTSDSCSELARPTEPRHILTQTSRPLAPKPPHASDPAPGQHPPQHPPRCTYLPHTPELLHGQPRLRRSRTGTAPLPRTGTAPLPRTDTRPPPLQPQRNPRSRGPHRRRAPASLGPGDTGPGRRALFPSGGTLPSEREAGNAQGRARRSQKTQGASVELPRGSLVASCCPRASQPCPRLKAVSLALPSKTGTQRGVRRDNPLGIGQTPLLGAAPDLSPPVAVERAEEKRQQTPSPPPSQGNGRPRRRSICLLVPWDNEPLVLPPGPDPGYPIMAEIIEEERKAAQQRLHRLLGHKAADEVPSTSGEGTSLGTAIAQGSSGTGRTGAASVTTTSVVSGLADSSTSGLTDSSQPRSGSAPVLGGESGRTGLLRG